MIVQNGTLTSSLCLQKMSRN